MLLSFGAHFSIDADLFMRISFGYKFLNGFCAAEVGSGMNNDFVAAVLAPGVSCICVGLVGVPTFVNMNAGRGPFEILTAKARNNYMFGLLHCH